MSVMTTKQIQPLLKSLVNIRESGVRSVNIEQDLKSTAIAKNYILTAQSMSCLGRLTSRLGSAIPSRAWTLTGPYGSGKSYFGLFLLNLLSETQAAHAHVVHLLKDKDPLLAEQIIEKVHLENTAGLLTVPVTGHRASFFDCLQQGFDQALKLIATTLGEKTLVNILSKWPEANDSRSVIRWIQELIEIITSAPFRYSGILLVFDEMGKPLEYSSTHPDVADVYLLQELAEYANRSGNTPFVFVGILHQSFERYAALLDMTTQREWSKVQGRFEDITFQEPPSQQMWLIANAFQYTKPDRLNGIGTTLKNDTAEALKSGWCPPTMKPEEFEGLATQVYPLHPTSLVTLPFLFRRLAQNERSLFSYLASLEPFGLQEFLQLHKTPDMVRLSDLFDYLAANFQGRLYASNRARSLTEAMERLNNSIRLNDLEARLLKTIGLLNWLREVSHLQANEQSLICAVRSPGYDEEAIKEGLRSLQKRSLIVFRKYNRTYTIWQGSDVDIEERMDVARQHLSPSFSIAEAIQKYLEPNPISARRHSYQTGTQRYFEVRYLDMVIRDQVSLMPSAGANGIIFLCLPANVGETDSFQQWTLHGEAARREDILIGIAIRTVRLMELLQEMRCLHWVKENTPELCDDPVARKELRTRISDIETLIRSELDRALNLYRLSDGNNCKWYHLGEEILFNTGQSISHQLSNICERLYSNSPRLRNELVNRRSLSSQGAAARRNLIEALLTRAEQPKLGIEGFPPERSMYESLIFASGIHRQIDSEKWKIGNIPDSDPLHLIPVWGTISEYFFQVPPQPRPLKELYKILSEPPFGLTEGVLPVVLCAFMVANRNQVTLYRESTLLPEPGIPDWEVLLRRPELFAVAGCKLTGTHLTLIERFAAGLQTEPAVMPVVRKLIQQMNSLSEYTRHTSNLPQAALAVRKAVEIAHSPERFLFHDLPVAVGVHPFTEETLDLEQVEQFFNHLNQALMSLNVALPKLRSWALDIFLDACELPIGTEGWDKFRALSDNMVTNIADPTLVPLLKRAVEAPNSNAALDSVLAQVANRPIKTWTDMDVERFTNQAQFYGSLFLKESRRISRSATKLTAVQRIRSQQVARDIRSYLGQQFQEDPEVIRAALFLLLDDEEPDASL
jgi:hypothetical protein